MLNQEQQIFKQIEKATSILIAFPKSGEGEALSTALAWFLFLKKSGKNVEIAGGQSANRKAWSFLPAFESLQDQLDNLRKFIVSLNIKNAKIGQIKYVVENDTLNFIISPKSGWLQAEDISSSSSGFKYDLIIVIGSPDLESLGDLYDQNVEFFYKTTIINLDNHPDNEEYGQINFIDLNVLSLAEASFSLFKNHNAALIDPDIATCLLAGIIARTKNFKTPNLTPRILLSTSELIDLGAKREEIVDRLYRSKGLSALKLWGQVLNSLQTEAGNHLVWSTLDASQLAPGYDPENDLIDIIDELIINIPETKIIVTFYPGETLGETRALVYAIKNLKLREIFSAYQPSGALKAIKITIPKNLTNATAEIIELAKKTLVKIV